MIYQCRLFDSNNKDTTLVQGVDNRGGCASMGFGGIWELSVLSKPFCCELKTILKIKPIERERGSPEAYQTPPRGRQRMLLLASNSKGRTNTVI